MKRVAIFVDLYNFLAYSSKYLGNNAYIDMVNMHKHFLKENEEIYKVFIYGGSSMQGMLYKLSHYNHIQIIEEDTGWDNKDKRTDVNLAVDMVVNAYKQKFDSAVLISGDSDFIRAVQEVRNLGKEVYIATPDKEGFDNARKLISSADGYYSLDVDFYKKYWIKGKPFKVTRNE